MESTDTGTQVEFVKSAALSYGYRRLKFYQLSSDGSEGSRELLLVFSWLLCRINLMEQLLTRSRLILWDEAIVCMCDTSLKSLRHGRTLTSKTHVEGPRDVRYLQWLNGRLQFRWRSCHPVQQEQCKLLHKVHSHTIGCHTDPIIGHFSVTEVDVVRQPDSYKQFLQLVESNNSRLEAFLKWKSMEPVYWHWMETVLDHETEDAKSHNVCNKDILLPSGDLACYGISRTVEELIRCRKDLMALSDELHELVTYRKRGCCGKAREQEQLGEKEFCRAVKKAQDVVELKLSDLKCHSSACRINKIHGPYRLVFKGKCSDARKMNFIRSAASNEAIIKGIAATDIIHDLKKQEARLKAELKQREEESRKKVHEAAKGLGHMLFITPMKRPNARNAN